MKPLRTHTDQASDDEQMLSNTLSLWLHEKHRTVTIDSQSSCRLLVPAHTGVAPSIRQIQVLDHQLSKTSFPSHLVFTVWHQDLPILPPLNQAARPAQLALQRGRPALRGLLVLQLSFETDWKGWEMQNEKGLQCGALPRCLVRG